MRGGVGVIGSDIVNCGLGMHCSNTSSEKSKKQVTQRNFRSMAYAVHPEQHVFSTKMNL